MSQPERLHPEPASQQTFDALATQAQGRWGLQQATRRLLARRENAVYELRRPEGERTVLRIHRHGYHTLEALQSELQWMQALNDAGVETPDVIRTADGDLFAQVRCAHTGQEHLCDLLGWVDGDALGRCEDPQSLGSAQILGTYRTVGQTAARIHQFSSTWPLPAGFTRPHWDLDGCLGEHDSLWGCWQDLAVLTPPEREVLGAGAARITTLLQAFGRAPDRYGLVHADLVPDNLIDDGQRIVVLDFDDSGFGWHLWELVTAVFWYLDTPHYAPALQGYVEGYRSVRDLPDEHLALLPAFLLLRSLVYMGWMHTRRGQPTAVQLTGHIRDTSLKLALDLLGEDAPAAARERVA
jgi:Ser/Thr protein kinase RdoA (MazF antagonist)